MDDPTLTLLVTIISSTALSSLVQFLVTLFFSRKDKIKELASELKETNKKIDTTNDKIDRNQAILARTHILRFADELRDKRYHSDESFRQQILDCDTYDRYCRDHPDFSNGLTIVASDYIRHEYRNLYLEGGNQDETAR